MRRKFTKYPNSYVKASISDKDKTYMFNYIREIYKEDKFDNTVSEIADEYEISADEAAKYVKEWLDTAITKYSEDLEPEIFEFLDDYGGYGDYNQKVADVSEQWNMPRDLAEDYVWNWSIQVDIDEDDEDEEYEDDEDEED